MMICDHHLILTDYRCGRNLARTFLQYYRFINVLPVPLPTEVRQKKRRPRTHQSRSRSKNRYEVKPRPKTTRCYAPISYTNLSICYDSGGSSDEGGFSPTRTVAPGSSHFSGYRNYRRVASCTTTMPSAQQQQQTHDQFALLRIKSGRFDLAHDHPSLQDYCGVGKSKSQSPEKQTRFEVPVNVPPKPYLSIIDLNQLTRGSLKMKSASFDD